MKEVIYQNIVEEQGTKYLVTGYEEKLPNGTNRVFTRCEAYIDPKAQTKLF
jgi:hypothetical protein